MTDRTTDRPAGQTARNWFLIGSMAVDGDATLEQTKQFACYCPVLGSSKWLVIVSASATFCLCLFSLRRGGRGEIKSTITPQLNCIFIIFAKKKKRETPKKNDPSKPRNCIELSLNCLWFVWNSRLAGNLLLSYFSWIFILQARSSSFFNWDKIYRRRRLSCGGERMATPIPIAVTTKLKL